MPEVRRRQFIRLLGGAAGAWPLVARAQHTERMRRIGVLMGYPESDQEAQDWYAAFREGLQTLGWTEGRNLRIALRWRASNAESAQRLAKELVALQPELIVSQSTPTTAALLQETRNIPIIFPSISDPVGSGFIASLARPGGNATGSLNLEGSLGSKWLELLKEIAPRVVKVAMLFNPDTAPGGGSYYLGPFEAAATSIGVEAIAARVHDTSELESAVAAQGGQPNTGLIVMADFFMLVHRAEIISLANRYRLPAIYPFHLFVKDGGLLSYGNNIVNQWRHAASYVDRILKGEKPADLPVEAPTKYELVINLKAAKVLGLDVPWILQQRADEVIE